MSRSFGDLRLKEPLPLVISEPEIRIEELTPKDEFLIIASGWIFFFSLFILLLNFGVPILTHSFLKMTKKKKMDFGMCFLIKKQWI